MTRLSHAQWQRLNHFTAALHEDVSEENFFECCLEKLPKVMDLLCVAWNDFNADFAISGNRETAAYVEDVAKYLPVMCETMHTHPVVQVVKSLHDEEVVDQVYAMTDFVSFRELRERPIHFETYRHLEIKDQMYTELEFSGDHRGGLTFNTGKVVTPEQKFMATLVRQHLTLAYRNLVQLKEVPTAWNFQGRTLELWCRLTPRQQEVAGYLFDGLSRKMIADKMDLSIHTLNDHVRGIYAKLKVHSHAEMMMLFANRSHRFPPKSW